MPGSKRRALKNLLSPHSQPQSDTPSPSAASASGGLHPVADSGTSLSSITSGTSSIASNPNNYLTDEQLEQDLELEKMAERQEVIGTGQQASVDAPVGVKDGLPPAQTAPPPPPQDPIGLQGQMPGGAEAGGGKKKSSKQKFAERQVNIKLHVPGRY